MWFADSEETSVTNAVQILSNTSGLDNHVSKRSVGPTSLTNSKKLQWYINCGALYCLKLPKNGLQILRVKLQNDNKFVQLS